MDLASYRMPTLFEDKKAPAYRFQELVLKAVRLFKIEGCWEKMVWGLIGKNRKKNEDFTLFQLERAIRETQSKKLDNPSRYFIRLLVDFLK